MNATGTAVRTATAVRDVDLGGLHPVAQTLYRLGAPIEHDGGAYDHVVASSAWITSVGGFTTPNRRIVETVVFVADADGKTQSDSDLMPMENPTDHADALGRLGYTVAA